MARSRLCRLLIGVVVVIGTACGSGQHHPPQNAALAVPDFTLTPARWTGAPPFTLSQHLDRPTLLYFMAA
jgi:hypothetical protein